MASKKPGKTIIWVEGAACDVVNEAQTVPASFAHRACEIAFGLHAIGHVCSLREGGGYDLEAGRTDVDRLFGVSI